MTPTSMSEASDIKTFRCIRTKGHSGDCFRMADAGSTPNDCGSESIKAMSRILPNCELVSEEELRGEPGFDEARRIFNEQADINGMIHSDGCPASRGERCDCVQEADAIYDERMDAEALDARRRAELEEADREAHAGDVDDARDFGWREEL